MLSYVAVGIYGQPVLYAKSCIGFGCIDTSSRRYTTSCTSYPEDTVVYVVLRYSTTTTIYFNTRSPRIIHVRSSKHVHSGHSDVRHSYLARCTEYSFEYHTADLAPPFNKLRFSEDRFCALSLYIPALEDLLFRSRKSRALIL